MKAPLIVSLATLAACFPTTPPPNPAMAAWRAQVNAPRRDAPVCPTAIAELDKCSAPDPRASILQPKPDQARNKAQFDQVLALSRQGLRRTCPHSNLAVHFANQDRCIADRRAAYKRAQAEQRERLPAERRRVASVRHDAHYALTLDRFRRATDDGKRAREDLDDARHREGLDCGRRQADCRRLDELQGRIAEADQARDHALGKLRAIATEHHIDERDGEQLGLW